MGSPSVAFGTKESWMAKKQSRRGRKQVRARKTGGVKSAVKKAVKKAGSVPKRVARSLSRSSATLLK